VRPAAVKTVQVSSRNPPAAWQDVIELASARRIPVTSQRAESSGRRRGRSTERTGAGSAQVVPPSPVPLENLLRSRSPRDVWLALDQVQDPQNVGALFRLAGFFGACGIVLTKDRSASVNDTVCDVAAGGVEHVPFAVVPNLAQAFRTAQNSGIWVLGTCERATDSIRDIDRGRQWMLVVGNEADGLRRLSRDRCDQLVALPPTGPIPSLNVAAAAAACLAILTTP